MRSYAALNLSLAVENPRSPLNSVQTYRERWPRSSAQPVASNSNVLDVTFTYCGSVVGLLAPSVVVVVLVVVDVELLGLLVLSLV